MAAALPRCFCGPCPASPGCRTTTARRSSTVRLARLDVDRRLRPAVHQQAHPGVGDLDEHPRFMPPAFALTKVEKQLTNVLGPAPLATG